MQQNTNFFLEGTDRNILKDRHQHTDRQTDTDIHTDRKSQTEIKSQTDTDRHGFRISKNIEHPTLGSRGKVI